MFFSIYILIAIVVFFKLMSPSGRFRPSFLNCIVLSVIWPISAIFRIFSVAPNFKNIVITVLSFPLIIIYLPFFLVREYFRGKNIKKYSELEQLTIKRAEAGLNYISDGNALATQDIKLFSRKILDLKKKFEDLESHKGETLNFREYILPELLKCPIAYNWLDVAQYFRLPKLLSEINYNIEWSNYVYDVYVMIYRDLSDFKASNGTDPTMLLISTVFYDEFKDELNDLILQKFQGVEVYDFDPNETGLCTYKIE